MKRKSIKKIFSITQESRSLSNIKLIIVLVLLVLISGSVVLVYSLNDDKTIRIGAILSLTGPGKEVGEEIRDGMLLELDRINSFGGINGKKVELIIRDSESNSAKAVEEFFRLENEYDPLIYISTLSSVSGALAPLAEENRVPLIAAIAADPELTHDSEWVFRHFSTAKEEIPPIVDTLEKLKITDLGVIHLDDRFGNSMVEELREMTLSLDTPVTITQEKYGMKVKDHSGSISRLKDRQAIYLIGLTGHLKTLIKQIRSENYQGTILGPSTFCIPSIRTAPDIGEIYIAAPVIYNQEFIYAGEMITQYNEKYGKEFSHYSANGYNLIRILLDLLETTEHSREKIRDQLKSAFIFHGVFGTIDKEAGSHEMTYTLYPAKIKDGNIHYLQE